MNRILYIVAGVGLVGSGTAALIAGCGSDDAISVADQPDAAATSSSSSSGTASGSSSGSTSSSSSGGTTDGAADAAADAPIDPPGGGDAATNPTKVTCGATECTTPTQVCCRTFSDAGCIAANDTCNGVKTGCDEKADCQGNEICCATFASSACAASCGGGYQICKASSECDGGTCKEWSCPANQKVRACERPFVGCN